MGQVKSNIRESLYQIRGGEFELRQNARYDGAKAKDWASELKN
jgi:hypothetical protein